MAAIQKHSHTAMHKYRQASRQQKKGGAGSPENDRQPDTHTYRQAERHTEN